MNIPSRHRLVRVISRPGQKLTESGFPVTSGVTGNYRHGNKPQKRSNSSAHRHGGQR